MNTQDLASRIFLQCVLILILFTYSASTLISFSFPLSWQLISLLHQKRKAILSRKAVLWKRHRPFQLRQLLNFTRDLWLILLSRTQLKCSYNLQWLVLSRINCNSAINYPKLQEHKFFGCLDKEKIMLKPQRITTSGKPTRNRLI